METPKINTGLLPHYLPVSADFGIPMESQPTWSTTDAEVVEIFTKLHLSTAPHTAEGRILNSVVMRQIGSSFASHSSPQYIYGAYETNQQIENNVYEILAKLAIYGTYNGIKDYARFYPTRLLQSSHATNANANIPAASASASAPANALALGAPANATANANAAPTPANTTNANAAPIPADANANAAPIPANANANANVPDTATAHVKDVVNERKGDSSEKDRAQSEQNGAPVTQDAKASQERTSAKGESKITMNPNARAFVPPPVASEFAYVPAQATSQSAPTGGRHVTIASVVEFTAHLVSAGYDRKEAIVEAALAVRRYTHSPSEILLARDSVAVAEITRILLLDYHPYYTPERATHIARKIRKREVCEARLSILARGM